MKFVQQYLTKHHLFHKPHAWFLALLIAPIHAAEMHYKNKYHLKFAHARKLFLFDLILLLSLFTIGIAALAWWQYDPTVTDLVYLSIHTETQRIESGERISYSITYKNSSMVTLKDALLTVQLPEGFKPDEPPSQGVYNVQTHTISLGLPRIEVGAEGNFSIEGNTVGTPQADYPMFATLSYRQETRERHEQKKTAHIAATPSSALQIELEVPDQVLSRGTAPFKLTLTNPKGVDLPTIVTPLIQDPGIVLQNVTSSYGTVVNNLWIVENLDKDTTAILQGTISTDVIKTIRDIALRLFPAFRLENRDFPQQTRPRQIPVVHPELIVTTRWTENLSVVPGQQARATITLINSGDVDVENVSVFIPLPSALISTAEVTRLNPGTYTNGNFLLTKAQVPGLSRLAKGQSVTHTLIIPISSFPQGDTDISFSLTPRVQASVPGVTQSLYETVGRSENALSIGTHVSLQTEGRYYTNEGDQLGRGPLPPQVGKETKYWAMITINNTTSKVENPTLTAQLPAYVIWTGKTSVTHGQNVVYNASSHTISWKTAVLNPHDTAGVYFELAITPTETQRGTTPVLVSAITFNGTDTYITKDISATGKVIDSSLLGDTFAQDKGVIVQ